MSSATDVKIFRSEKKCRWISSLSCVISQRAAQCAHVGGLAEGKGTGIKCSDEFTLPLAPDIHDQLDGRAKLPNGKTGKKAFEEFYHIDVIERAKAFHWFWLQTKGKN